MKQKYRCALQEKIPKLEQKPPKKMLGECCSTLEFFLVEHIFIFVLDY